MFPERFSFNFVLFFQMMRNVMENPAEPVNDNTYYACQEGVMEKSKVTQLN